MSKNLSLSEKLSSLIHTKPVLSDPDDDDDLTKPEQLAKNDDHSDYSADELELVKFRKLNIDFLDADDNKYSGKKSSRVEHADAFGSDSSDVEGTSDENQEDSVVKSDESSVEASDVEDEDDEDEDEEDDGEDIEYEDESFQEEKDPVSVNSSFDDKFNKEIISKASGDIEKGSAIKNQLHIWDFLLECRMKFQKSLTAANQLPKHDNLKKFREQGGEDFQNLLLQNQKSFQHLLNSFMNLQEVLLKRNDEFKQTTLKHKLPTSDDDEITSESDVEKENEEESEPPLKSKKKRRKLSDFSTEIDERHKQMEKFRNETIQKWNDKTRLGHISNKDFHGFEQSTLKQIEHVLQDKQRLIKRTQVKRSNYHILGQNDEEESPNKVLKTDESENQVTNEKERKICKEIFDDDDFYVQLLNELVKRKGNDITDPLQLGKQWVQLQKARSKVKKDIDRRASKGRKIRYVIHPKLVNFMMPITKSFCTEESRTELINSIFGKNNK